MKARIWVPDLNKGTDVVVAELSVPNGYYMQMWDNEVTFQRHTGDPEISLRSLATVEAEPGSSERPPLRFLGQACEGVPNGRRTQLDTNADGWSVVCTGETRHMPITFVVRDLRDVGNELQCVITFTDYDFWRSDDRDPNAASDHGRPSPARVADALAICASVTLRELREDEHHENWNGHEWVRSSG
ncbi:MAG: hypothetical protein ABI467_24190 [Kofleriaceae bacterium]